MEKSTKPQPFKNDGIDPEYTDGWNACLKSDRPQFRGCGETNEDYEYSMGWNECVHARNEYNNQQNQH